MKVFNVQEAKTHLSRFLEQAASGEVILIGKYGKPMAKLSAYAPHSELRPLGGLEGQIHLSPDFDDEDPFDRMLIAQAIHEDLTLITHNRKLEPYGIHILWT